MKLKGKAILMFGIWLHHSRKPAIVANRSHEVKACPNVVQKTLLFFVGTILKRNNHYDISKCQCIEGARESNCATCAPSLSNFKSLIITFLLVIFIPWKLTNFLSHLYNLAF